MSPFPRATYRLQFNREFTFADATRIVPYLARLGISHVYASPILKARPGSMHGYDVTDHTQLNPELGTREDFDRFTDRLREHGMGLVVDIVPIHPREYARIFVQPIPPERLSPDDAHRADFESLLNAFGNLPARNDTSED